MKITVHVRANSKGNIGVTLAKDDILDVRVGTPATEGRANQATIVQLAKYFNVSKSKVRLLRGTSSNYKLFDVDLDSTTDG